MSKVSGVAVALAGLTIMVLLVLETWYIVFDNVDRAFVLILWGTLTGTGSFGSQ